MTPQIIPQNYKATLGLKDTEIAIKKLKDYICPGPLLTKSITGIPKNGISPKLNKDWQSI